MHLRFSVVCQVRQVSTDTVKFTWAALIRKWSYDMGRNVIPDGREKD